MPSSLEIKDKLLANFEISQVANRIIILILSLYCMIAVTPHVYADEIPSISSISQNSGTPGAINLPINITGNLTSWR